MKYWLQKINKSATERKGGGKAAGYPPAYPDNSAWASNKVRQSVASQRLDGIDTAHSGLRTFSALRVETTEDTESVLKIH